MPGGHRAHRRWWVVVLVALVGAAAGAVIGATRTRTYSSTATMSAGPISALSSAQAASQSNNIALASDYATMLTTATVARRVAAQLHTSTGDVVSHLSATAESGTALFDVTGQGTTARAARVLTMAAATSLRSYVDDQLATQRTQPQVLRQYQQAEQSSQSLKSRVAQLQAQPTTASNTAALHRVQSQLSVAQLKVQGLASLFMQGDQTTSIGQNAAPTLMAAPAAGTSTFKKRTSEFAVIGLIAGLCLGISLIALPSAVRPPGPSPRTTDDLRLGRV